MKPTDKELATIIDYLMKGIGVLRGMEYEKEASIISHIIATIAVNLRADDEKHLFIVKGQLLTNELFELIHNSSFKKAIDDSYNESN